MKRIRTHLSYANVAATLALLFAMSGGAIAATGGFSSGGTLRACVNEEGGLKLLKAGRRCGTGRKSIAWNVTGPAGVKGATGASGATGAAGPQGAAGKNGTNGAPGSALAFAHILGKTTPGKPLDTANSKNITAATVAKSNSGLYCITTSVPIQNLTGMVDFGGQTKNPQSVQANFTLLELSILVEACPPGTNVLVETPNNAGSPEPADFWVTFN
jgi:hypothetical protein